MCDFQGHRAWPTYWVKVRIAASMFLCCSWGSVMILGGRLAFVDHITSDEMPPVPLLEGPEEPDIHISTPSGAFLYRKKVC